MARRVSACRVPRALQHLLVTTDVVVTVLLDHLLHKLQHGPLGGLARLEG